MDAVEIIVAWGVISIAAGALGFFLASMKNRGASAWAAWCFILPPLVLVLLIARRNPGPRPRATRLDDLDRELL